MNYKFNFLATINDQNDFYNIFRFFLTIFANKFAYKYLLILLGSKKKASIKKTKKDYIILF